jgi:DNA-binding LacI/PurR family transcriptional regulator
MKSDTLTKKATIKEVAQHAGVSTATVSRVIAGGNNVSDYLRGRVADAVKALDYSPSQLGRNLRSQKTNFIGVIVCDIENPFFTNILRAIQDVLTKQNYVLLTTNSDEDIELERIHLKMLRANRVSGLILVPAASDYRQYQSLLQDMTVVAIDRAPHNLNTDTVTVDNLLAVKNAVHYLMDLGHRRIGYLTGDLTISTWRDRIEGFLAAHREVGHEIDPSLIQKGYFTKPDGHKAMEQLIHQPDPPTAVISGNNTITLGALQAIHDHSLRVPDELSIIGFDDMDWATSMQPPLSVIAQPTYEIGRRATEMLLERMDNPEMPVRHIVLETELILRASTGPAKIVRI